MKATDIQQVVSQAQRVEQAQQALTNQAAAQQQAAVQKVEARRLEMSTRPEPAEPRGGRSAVYNDERKDGGNSPRGGGKPRKQRKGPNGEILEEGSQVDRLA